MPKWTREQADALIHTLAVMLSPRYHLALAGSVLLWGKSDNDLDLVVYPASTLDRDLGFVEETLRRAGLRRSVGRLGVKAKWRREGSFDDKHVEVWQIDGKKVDLFFLA
jgi:hypothetical protein